MTCLAWVAGWLSFGPVVADSLRVASYNTNLERDGPGLLLRDIQRQDEQVTAVAQVIARVAPDIIALQGFDHDHDLIALTEFADLLATMGAVYPHRLALRPNSGWMTGLDLDGDGRFGGPRDAQSYGRYSGHSGMALLSRVPILNDQVRDLSDGLWADLADPPPSVLPVVQQTVQRLSTVGHWMVPVQTDQGPVTLILFHATPPVFDGPEDRNGHRNADELRLVAQMIDGVFGAPAGPVVVLGDANSDPQLGEGHKPALRRLLDHPQLQDPWRGNDVATVHWTRLGEMRVDYVLPDRAFAIVGKGVHWPRAGPVDDVDKTAQPPPAVVASHHRLVWVDVARR